MQEPFKDIKEAINQLLNVKSVIRQKKQSKKLGTKELFISVVTGIQMLSNRSNLAYNDLHIDFTSFEEPYLQVIDTLILLKFGREVSDLISFYLWERENPDGTLNFPLDENDEPVPLNDLNDLWAIVVKVRPDLLDE
jgi:hypothetical protein